MDKLSKAAEPLTYMERYRHIVQRGQHIQANTVNQSIFIFIDKDKLSNGAKPVYSYFPKDILPTGEQISTLF